MKKAFKDLTHDLWMDRYIVEREAPFQEEIKLLEKQVCRLDRRGYSAVRGK
jgi:hypothetical protein